MSMEEFAKAAGLDEDFVNLAAVFDAFDWDSMPVPVTSQK